MTEVQTANIKPLVKETLEVFRPLPPMLVSEWGAKHFEIPDTSAEPGKWNPNRAVYQKGILDAICQPGIQKITMMCSAQVGKTTLLLILICYFIDRDPCSMMFTMPTVDVAEIFSKEKLQSAITKIPVINEKITTKTRDSSSTMLMKMFVGGFLRICGANSPNSLSSTSIRLYFGDEVDKYPPTASSEGDPVNLAKQRTETFWNWIIFLVSTPSLKNTSRIAQEYKASDQRKYFVACPECGHEQHFEWERFQYENKGSEDADPTTGVYYICESCQTPIAESHKSRMIANGQWKATAKAKDRRHAGFHINRFYSPWKGWIDLCLDYESSKDDTKQLQVFYNATLGLPFELAEKEQLDWEILLDRSVNSGYSKGEVPEGVLIIVAGVDIQSDRLEVNIVGYGKGEQCWVIDYQVILGNPMSDDTWEQLENLSRTEYSHKSGAKIKIRSVCIDSGYLTQEIYFRVRKNRILHWFAIKGFSGDKPLIATPSSQDISYRGQKIRHGIKLYKIGVDVCKETIYSRSQINKPGDKYINFPNDLGKDWFYSFCSEVQVTKHTNGRPHKVWEKLTAKTRNEVLDTFVYAYAAGHLAGMARYDWDKIEKTLKSSINSESIAETKTIAKKRNNRRKRK